MTEEPTPEARTNHISRSTAIAALLGSRLYRRQGFISKGMLVAACLLSPSAISSVCATSTSAHTPAENDALKAELIEESDRRVESIIKTFQFLLAAITVTFVLVAFFGFRSLNEFQQKLDETLVDISNRVVHASAEIVHSTESATNEIAAIVSSMTLTVDSTISNTVDHALATTDIGLLITNAAVRVVAQTLRPYVDEEIVPMKAEVADTRSAVGQLTESAAKANAVAESAFLAATLFTNRFTLAETYAGALAGQAKAFDQLERVSQGSGDMAELAGMYLRNANNSINQFMQGLQGLRANYSFIKNNKAVNYTPFGERVYEDLVHGSASSKLGAIDEIRTRKMREYCEPLVRVALSDDDYFIRARAYLAVYSMAAEWPLQYQFSVSSISNWWSQIGSLNTQNIYNVNAIAVFHSGRGKTATEVPLSTFDEFPRNDAYSFATAYLGAQYFVRADYSNAYEVLVGVRDRMDDSNSPFVQSIFCFVCDHLGKTNEFLESLKLGYSVAPEFMTTRFAKQEYIRYTNDAWFTENIWSKHGDN
ncbi:MAG: hypothetical protein M9910_06250 [Kiritimatiellae bacterium]|nr:hypothetical protein [Kiritimatiellia bacterium]